MTKARDIASATTPNANAALLATFPHRNLIINGAMQVAQRGTSFTGITSTIDYRMDRWQVGFGAAGSNYSITQSTDAPDNFKYSIKWQRTASNAVTNSIWFSQAFESVNSKVVAGKTCTLSYYAKKGANYSATSSDIQVRIISGTGTDQSATSAITAGWTGYATPLSTTQVVTSSWVRYSHTVTFASNINQISVNLASNSAGTAGADDSLYITGIQLELGSTATPFEHRSYGDELAACQRYCFVQGFDGTYEPLGIGYWKESTAVETVIKYPVPMRSAPSLSISTIGGLFCLIPNTDWRACSAFSLNEAGKNGCKISLTVATNGNFSTDGRRGSTIAFRSSGQAVWDAEL